MSAEADRKERQLAVLGEVVADHGVARGLADVDVGDTPRNPGLGARGRAKVLGIHREGVASLLVRPSIGMPVPAGGRRMSAVERLPSHRGGAAVVVRREHMPPNVRRIHLSWRLSPLRVIWRPTGGWWGWQGFSPRYLGSFTSRATASSCTET